MMTFNRKTLYYLAGPYTHESKAIMNEREIQHSKCAVALKNQGMAVYAPIPETTSLAKLGGMQETNWESWRDHDLNMLDRCDELLIMNINGWIQSKGVRGEVKFALQKGLPVHIIPEDGSYIMTLTKEALLELFGVSDVEMLND